MPTTDSPFCSSLPYGQAATCDAFGVSRRTLYRWPPALSQEIRRLRTTYPNLGQAKLPVLLRPWGAQQNLALPSVSTLGSLTARAPDKLRHAPSRLAARGRPKPGARPRKARQPKGIRHGPLQVFACDTVVRLQASLRRYLFTFIDPHTHFAVAFAAATPSSRQATLALDALCHLLPPPPRFVFSDNGSEFLGHFQQRREERGITHWWTYPRSPKMNAHAERFNRTLQEQFVDYHEDLLFDHLAAFNRKLADWLLAYTTVLPHHSLGRHSPVQCLIQHQLECQRWWTHTLC